MKKQGLIAVDLDGTLFDTVAVNAESYRRALESFGFTVDYDYYAAYCNGSHYRAFLQPLMGGSPSAEDVERLHASGLKRDAKYLEALREMQGKYPLFAEAITAIVKYGVTIEQEAFLNGAE